MPDTNAPSFATSSANGYTINVTASSATMDQNNTLLSPVFGETGDYIENKKVVMGIDIKTAYSNVVAPLKLQVSHNGTDFSDHSTLIADTTPDVAGVKTTIADLTSTYAPYYRLVFNDGGLSVGVTGTAQFFFAYK